MASSYGGIFFFNRNPGRTKERLFWEGLWKVVLRNNMTRVFSFIMQDCYQGQYGLFGTLF
jgi:hypothetical protein